MEYGTIRNPYDIWKTLGKPPMEEDQLMEAVNPSVDLINWVDSFLNYASPPDIGVAPAAEVRRRHMESLENCRVSLKMRAASIYIPKGDPENPRGEDAHFVSSEFQTFGVADGVGGWRRKGIDGGEYARRLMKNSTLALQNEPKGEVNPKRVLQEAYNYTAVQGSSTACIVTLSGNKLRAANVGDSGFLIIRNGTVVYKSPTQQKRFNCPYQLGEVRDDPSVADEIEVAVEKGDIVVAGTDGLLDNFHESEILKIIGNPITKKEKWLVKQACYNMAKSAFYNSIDQCTDTPFSIEARRSGIDYIGGKPDDITVIIAPIEEH